MISAYGNTFPPTETPDDFRLRKHIFAYYGDDVITSVCGFYEAPYTSNSDGDDDSWSLLRHNRDNSPSPCYDVTLVNIRALSLSDKE